MSFMEMGGTQEQRMLTSSIISFDLNHDTRTTEGDLLGFLVWVGNKL